MGKEMLKNGEKFNEKVEDVNEGIQGIIDKLGDAAKHTTKALQQGFFAVLGLGQDANGAFDKKQGHPDTVENIKKPQGVVEVIGDVTKKTTDGIKNGLSTLFNLGNGFFKFGDKKNQMDDSSANLVERVDVRGGGEDSFDDFKRNLNNEINSYKYSASEPVKKY
ncbi:uncharacterized protein LOC122859745 [Aphidius gifuensis]|uniref:uncharacterized protein LOC122859745 n=1 Tax=Aphidius gifuensis TaxID=684658 RepID=UPI001CDC52B7|nr:uncharacterized protein LOC122859745 [Aphidius gifuensis]